MQINTWTHNKNNLSKSNLVVLLSVFWELSPLPKVKKKRKEKTRQPLYAAFLVHFTQNCPNLKYPI